MKNKITSLLIDATADQRTQFYLSLDLLGVNRACVCHDNCFDALAFLKQQPDFIPDFIFISADLSHTAVFISYIRKLNRLAAVPVVMLAATPLSDISSTGFTECLVKQRDIYLFKEALKGIFEKDYPVSVGAAPFSTFSNKASRIREVVTPGTQTLPETPRRLSA